VLHVTFALRYACTTEYPQECVFEEISGTESTGQNFVSLARFSTTFQMYNHDAYQIE
jgi:hypothetical protein